MKKVLIVVVAIVALIGIYGFGIYNKLVTSNEGVDAAWAQVETQYQRRFDLIPNLVESVKGIMQQEQQVFNALADARTKYAGAQTIDDKAVAAGQVETSLARLLVVMENYPQLRSVETVQNLMVQLEGTENRVSVERMRFNESVQVFNLMVKRLPSSIVASIAGFDERAYFDAAAGSENAPSVKF
jgi:LemA protein